MNHNVTVTMALSNKKILEAIKTEDVVIHPFKLDNLATSSYDVTLGEFYFREHPIKHSHNIYNIWSKTQTEQVWGTEPEKAERASVVFDRHKLKLMGIKPSDKIILLRPGETILAHTNEFIGGRNHITTMMKARSSLGRSFIEICKCAGWGDVGYINRWTMEITNNSLHYSIPLVVGRRLAQIIFFETGPILDARRDYTKLSGKYQRGGSLADLIKNWTPQSMLPRLYEDREVKTRPHKQKGR